MKNPEYLRIEFALDLAAACLEHAAASIAQAGTAIGDTIPQTRINPRTTVKPSILSTARLSLPLATALAALLSAQSASAQSGTWTQTAAGPFNWDDIANWSGGAGPIADGADFTASFVADITAAQTVSLNIGKTIGNITFNDATSSHDLIIGGANTLTLGVTSGSPVISVLQAARLLSISSPVAGTAGLTKSGLGVLSLAGANTYSGVTDITAGRLAVSSTGALGNTSGITIGGASAATLSSGTTGLIITSPITTANTGVNSTLAFGVASSAVGNFTLNGALGGSGNVVFTTIGTSNNFLQTINLGAAGTYTGTTTITSGTTANSMFVKAGVDDALPSTTVLTINGGNGTGSGRASAYDLNGFNQTLAGLTNTTGLSSRAQRVINTNADTLSTLTVNNATDFTYSGTIGGNTNLGAAASNLALTKNGAGTLTLGVIGGATANPHAYSGATTILGGTLRLATTAAITASSGITINGSTAKLLQTSNTAITPAVTLIEGTLTGSGSVNTVTVGNGTGGIVSNNNGVAGAALTIGTLTFDGAATVNTFSNSAAAAIVTTSLATHTAGTVTIHPAAASWAAGTYDLISYGGGSIAGGGFAQFALGTVSGASVRQGPVLGDSGTAITLTVGPDDAPYWAGDGDGKWNLSATNNWKLTSNNGATTFLATDNVVFNDSATGAGPIFVDIDLSDVSPSSATFDNSAKDFVLSSSGTFGIATGSLTKNGSGTLTVNTANTYTGDTLINAGTLSLGDGGTTGSLSPSSAISVASGAIFAVNQSDTVTQGTDFGVISGGGGFAQLGAGTTVLDLINGFSGPISITNGSLAIGPNGRLGAGTYAGNIDIAPATSMFEHGGTLNQTLSGIISGEGSLLKSGSNTLTLSGANTYEGATTVNQGILSIANVNALQNTSAITLGGASAATLSTATTGITISAPITTANTGVDSTIAFATSVSATQGSINLNGAIGGAGNVIFSSPNVGASTGQTQFINLGATGTWAGSTTLTTGNSQVAPRLVNTSGAANVLPVTTVLRMTGGTGNGTGRGLTFDLNGQNQELAGLQNTLAVDRDQRVTSVNPATLTINNSDDYSFGGTIGGGDDDGSGKIVGAISLTKAGPAKFTLTGSHDYTGDTTVTQGILSQEAANGSNETSTVTIAETGATLDLNFTGTDTIDKLFIGSTQLEAPHVYGKLGSELPVIGIAQITGDGTLTVTTGPGGGGYATWAGTNAGDEGADLDFDKDGVANGVEFFMNAPAGFTENPQLNASNTITWPNGGNIPASAYGTQFVVQTSSDLTIWADVLVGDLAVNTDGPGGSLTYTLTGGAPRFVRLKVTPD
jgi:autotransporter-associated beta strand protein